MLLVKPKGQQQFLILALHLKTWQKRRNMKEEGGGDKGGREREDLEVPVLEQGLVTYTSSVEVFATGIKNLDQ